MKIAWLIFNPAAGRGDAADLSAIVTALGPHFDLHVVWTTLERSPTDCAKEALAANADLVIAAGGDGTVSMVAAALTGTKTPLAITPRGTASSIAMALGIPSSIPEACALIIEGEARAIDTAVCNEQSMLLLCAIGLQADTVGETTREAKNRWGILAYLATGFKKLSGLQPFEVEMETEDDRIRCSATAVTIANLAPPRTVLAQGPATIDPDDGFFDVTVVAATKLTEAVATGVHLFRSAINNEPAERDNVGYFSARALRITADPPQHILIDGEPAGETPLSIECRPKSLWIIAPPDAVNAERPESKLDGLPDLEVLPK